MRFTWELMRGAAATALFAASLPAAGPSLSQLRDPWHAAKRHSDPAASSKFLPASFDVGTGARLDAFRALASRLRQDSTRHFEIKNGRLRVSYDMMQDLAGGSLSPAGGRLGEKLAAFLSGRAELTPSGTAHADYLPDDDMLLNGPQWALHNTGTAFDGKPGKPGMDINIEKVWDKFSGSDTLVIAVIDAGFDFNHPDLKGKNWINQAEAHGQPGVDDDGNGFVDDSLGWDFVENDNLPQDRHGHGTYISSVIAAGFDNHTGVAGMCAQAKIMPVRVLDASGHGDQTVIAKGILYAVRNGAKAINFSIGGDADVPALKQAFQTAQAAGVPIIVASGNDAIDINAHPQYPASYTFDNMLVVAAHDHAGDMCAFSNYGRTSVHLAAPGDNILVCGLPPPVVRWYDGFETASLRWDTTAGAWGFTSVNPLELKQSIQWKAGNNVTLTSLDTFDLTGIEGAYLSFRSNYRAANSTDAFVVEGNKVGTSTWTEIAVIGGILDSTTMYDFGLQDFDKSRFRLRFRTVLSTRFSAAGRVLKLDEVLIRSPGPIPSTPVYQGTSGTSLAAPHVTAYVGLLRLACDRMGVAYNRAKALEGVDTEASLTGKVSSNGRLDVFKGLRFYLETLPDFHVLDSTALTWKAGKPLQYTLELSPSPSATYAFAQTGLPGAALIDGAGKLTWTPAETEAGDYVARFTAQGPTVLRKAVAFKVEPGDNIPVPLANATGARAAWIVAGQRFLLPSGLTAGRHLVEIFATDAAGKVQLLKRGWMDAPALAPAPVPDARAAVLRQWRVRVDGNFLASAR